MWSRLLDNANLGVTVYGQKINSYLYADDSLGMARDIHTLLTLACLYEYFADTYNVEYGYAKTILNIFKSGLKQKIESANLFKMKNIPPLYDSDSIHLGMVVTEEMEKTNEKNVDTRIQKTMAKVFTARSPTVAAKRRHRVDYLLKLHNTLYKPSLLSGLSILPLEKEDKNRLDKLERGLIRWIFRIRTKGAVKQLFKMTNVIPASDCIERDQLNLLYNLLHNKDTPVYKMIKYIADNKIKSDEWCNEITRLLKKYKLPQLQDILNMDPPKKSEWKRVLKNQYWQIKEIADTKDLNNKSSTPYFNTMDFEIDGKVAPILTAARTERQIKAMQITVKHLIGEYNNMLCRIKRLQINIVSIASQH